MTSSRVNVYNVKCQLDGEWASVNVWAYGKTEAVQNLQVAMMRRGVDKVGINHLAKIATDEATMAGTVLVLA